MSKGIKKGYHPLNIFSINDVQAAICLAEMEFFYQEVLNLGIMRKTSRPIADIMKIFFVQIIHVHRKKKCVSWIELKVIRIKLDRGIPTGILPEDIFRISDKPFPDKNPQYSRLS